MLVEVGRVEEFSEGVPEVKVVGKLHVAVVKLGGRFYAFESLCPHAKWSLGFAGRCFVDRGGRPRLLCVMHGGLWSLDDGSGEVQGKSFTRLKLYKAVAQGGRVYVEV